MFHGISKLDEFMNLSTVNNISRCYVQREVKVFLLTYPYFGDFTHRLTF